MKFLVLLCLLATAAAEEDKIQDKKTQPIDPTQSTSGLPQTNSLLNGQVFPPAPFFGVNDAVSNLAYAGLNTNVSPIQPVNPDFFAPSQQVVNAAPISTFPITRTVLPGSSAVVGGIPSGIQSGIQSAFPSGVFPAAVNGIAPQIPAITQPYIQPVSAVPAQFTTGVVDPNVAAANGAISAAQTPAYRFLPAEGLAGIPTQGLQAVQQLQGLQQVGLAAIPAFTSGILPTFANGALQAQNIPAGIQQVLKNPTGAGAGIPQTLATSSLGNIYRQA